MSRNSNRNTRGRQWSRRSGSFNDGGRYQNHSRRFEEPYPQIQGGSYRGLQDQTFYQGFQEMNQPYPPRNRFQTPGSNQDYPPGMNQFHRQVSDEFLDRRNQFQPSNSASPFGRSMDQYNKDEIMTEAMSSLREKYNEAMNAIDSVSSSMENSDQRHRFQGPSEQNMDFATDVEFQSTDQFFSQTEGVGHDDNYDYDDYYDGPIVNEYRDEYIRSKLAERKVIQRRLDKRLKKTGHNTIMDRVQKRDKNRNRRLFKTRTVEPDPVEEAKYVEEYKLVEHVPPIEKKWFEITIDDIRNRAGLVGNIVIMYTTKDTHYNTLEKTAETWNMKYELTSEECKSENEKGTWISTATFNGVVLAKTKCETRGGARAAASARALWKLYQWYFVVKKGGAQTTQTINQMQLMGDARVKDMVIHPNCASQLKNKKAKEFFNLNGTLEDLKNKIKAYADDNTNLSDLVFSDEFNGKTRNKLMEYARTFKCLQPRRCGMMLNRQVVLSKRVNAATGISGWELIEDILKNRSVYKTTRQYELYAPGDFSHEIPYKYPNVTYFDEDL